jgi:hypothetical protein
MATRTYPYTVCNRCSQRRWPSRSAQNPFTCQRCAALAGDPHTVDPLPVRSPAQQVADERRGAHLQALRDVRKRQRALAPGGDR